MAMGLRKRASAVIVLAVGLLIVGPVAPASAGGGFYTWSRPTDRYFGKTCKYDIHHFPDTALVNYIVQCRSTVTFRPTLEKRDVPSSWPNWSAPPYSEFENPAVLWTRDATELTLLYTRKDAEGVKTIGFEAQPAEKGTHTIVADFFDQNGALIGTISRDVAKNAGARLFAGQSTIDSVKISKVRVSSDVSFAIAELRVDNPAPS